MLRASGVFWGLVQGLGLRVLGPWGLRSFGRRTPGHKGVGILGARELRNQRLKPYLGASVRWYFKETAKLRMSLRVCCCLVAASFLVSGSVKILNPKP